MILPSFKTFPKKAIKRIRYHVVDPLLCRGMPFAKEVWERQFKTGFWEFLNSENETARYSLIIGFIQGHPSLQPSILDLGCGHGRLLQMLRLTPFKSYLGVDVSETAIDQAKEHFCGDAVLLAADVEHWQPSGRYNVIVFNEVLYYLPRPLETITRYSTFLANEGMMIISMVDGRNHRLMWNKIAQEFQLTRFWRIENERRQAWQVGLLEFTPAE